MLGLAMIELQVSDLDLVEKNKYVSLFNYNDIQNIGTLFASYKQHTQLTTVPD